MKLVERLLLLECSPRFAGLTPFGPPQALYVPHERFALAEEQRPFLWAGHLPIHDGHVAATTVTNILGFFDASELEIL